MSDCARRFWEKVDKSGECWLWTGSRSQNGVGYGQFWIHQRERVSAHVWSWEMANAATVEPGFVVMHSCDNKACVKPAHLSLGRQSQNVIDRLRKHGRKTMKLSEDQVREIRKLSTEGLSSAQIAPRFGVHPGYVRKVVRGTWRAYVQ